MKKAVFFVFWLLAATVSAQNISNVDFQQVGDEIVVTYNLDESADVWLYVSLDGGKTYTSVFSMGRAVRPGKRQFVWKVLYDIPEGFAGQVRFVVSTNLLVPLGGIVFKMVYVKGGTFMMGATEEQGSDALDDEKPVHEVTLSDYYIGKFEVTQGLWEKVMGTTIRQQRDKADSSWPLYGEGSDYPMYYVNWEEAQEFCRRLSLLTGKTYVLPTEAQWEYAARGGVKSIGYKYSGSDDIDKVAWYRNNSGSSTHPVGRKQANELGLYDMSGNVWEWCSDWYASNYYSNSPQSNPTGPSTGSYRVLRGGSWDSNAGNCRVSDRSNYYPDARDYVSGFRVVLLP